VTTDDVLGFAVSDAYVYVATREIGTDGPVPDGGTILRIPNGGGAPVSLIKGQSQPASIAVDDTAIYWVNGETSSPSALVRASLDGSSVTTLVTGAVGTPSAAICRKRSPRSRRCTRSCTLPRSSARGAAHTP
jgi:hypothetical protein